VTRGKTGEGGDNLLAAEPISASQYPLGFEKHRRADVHILAMDQRTRPPELLGVVTRQVADDDVSIDREHGVASLQSLSPHPCPPMSSAVHDPGRPPDPHPSILGAGHLLAVQG